jgi:hypothetical protein
LPGAKRGSNAAPKGEPYRCDESTKWGAQVLYYLCEYAVDGTDRRQAITVDGVAYTVREVRALDDGKLMQATLSKS